MVMKHDFVLSLSLCVCLCVCIWVLLTSNFIFQAGRLSHLSHPGTHTRTDLRSLTGSRCSAVLESQPNDCRTLMRLLADQNLTSCVRLKTFKQLKVAVMQCENKNKRFITILLTRHREARQSVIPPPPYRRPKSETVTVHIFFNGALHKPPKGFSFIRPEKHSNPICISFPSTLNY